MSQLSDMLRNTMAVRGWGYRKFEEETGISKSTLSNILTDEDKTPSLETLVKISEWSKIPLGEVIEMCGLNLGVSVPRTSQAQRIANIIGVMPQLDPILDRLQQLPPKDLDAVLAYLEGLHQRSER